MKKSFFSENLKSLRKYKKMTLEDLAEALNVSKSAISDYENNKFSPSLAICRKVAEYFGTSIDNLEFSDILEKNENGELKIVSDISLNQKYNLAKEFSEVLEKQKYELMLELRLHKQKVEGLQLQMRLQDQLKESKFSEIELLKSQILLLEDKIRLILR